jgi:hypothetical protein
MTEHTSKQKYLVVDDYGSGGIWFVLLAQTEAQIHERLRDVKVYSPGVKPEWMPHQELEDIARRDTHDIDELPESAWMDRLRANRE